MIYFYCKSYQSFLYAITLIEKDKEVTVITPTEDIIKTCKKIKIKYISHINFTPIEAIRKYKRVNIELKRITELIGGEDIHFTHTQFALFCFLLINNLASNGNKIFFYNFEMVYEIVKSFHFSLKFIKSFFLMKLINMLYDTNFVLKTTGPHFVLSIDDKFLNSRNVIIADNKETYFDEIVRGINNFCFQTKKYNLVFISQKLQKMDFINQDEYSKVVAFINEKKIPVKLHPYFNEEDIFPECEKIPDYLPIELIYGSIKSYVISVHSAALISASKFGNLKALSLLDIVKKDISFLSQVKIDLINKSDNKILFPKSLQELHEVLWNQ